jgi:hypothetical protein
MHICLVVYFLCMHIYLVVYFLCMHICLVVYFLCMHSSCKMVAIPVVDVVEEIINGDAPIAGGAALAATMVNLEEEVGAPAGGVGAAGGGGVRAMRWTNNTYGLFLGGWLPWLLMAAGLTRSSRKKMSTM